MTKARSLSDFIESDGSVTLVDNQKIKVGTGNDLEIYHDGSNSYITESNATGNLFIKGTHIYLQNSSGQDVLNLINGNAFIKSGGVTKLQTTSAGIDVTGTATATSVGIGTSNVDTPLTVSVADNTIATRFKATNGIFRVLPFETGLGVKVTALNGNESAFETLAYQAEDHQFVTGTTAAMTIDNSGNVDIKTGNLTIDGFTSGKYLTLRSGFAPEASGGVGLRAANHAASNSDGLALYGHDGVSIFTAQTERMRITSSGVGIGSDNPSAKLHVEGAGDSQILIYETGTSPHTATLKLASQSTTDYGANVQYTSDAEQLTIENFGRTISSTDAHGSIRFRTKVGNSSMQEVLHINGYTGNTGIGTASPLSKMTIAQTAGDTALTFQQTNNGTTNFLIGCQYNVANAFEITPSTAAGGSTFSTPALLVKSTGEVGIAGTPASGRNLHVHGIIRVENPHNSNYPVMEFFNTNGQVGGIRTSNSVTSYDTSSDYRLKENVQPIQNGLQRLNQLNPVKFDWKVDGTSSEGFIAHEVQEIFPDAVGGEKDGENMQSMDYGKITPLLVKAIQEQQTIIDDLTTRIEALEG